MASASPDVQERETDSGSPGPRNTMLLAAPSQGVAAPSDYSDNDDDFLLTPDDIVLLDSVKPATGGAAGDESALARALDKRSSSLIWQDDLELEIKMELEGTVEKGFPRIRRDDTKVKSLLDSFMDLEVNYFGLVSAKERFHLLSVDGSLPRSSFGACIGMKDEEFAGKLFDDLARRRNISRDTINITELSEFWQKISEGFLQIFFDMIKEADGKIVEEDVKKIVMFIASTNQMTNIKIRAEEYVRLIMEELDPSNLGYILVEDLEALLLQAPSQSMRQMLRQRLRPTAEPNPLRRWYRRAKYFLENNWRRVWVMLLWLSVCAGLFTWKLVQYRRRYLFQVMGYCVCVAKGGAETLKFNMALILLPVCRNTITRIRSSAAVGRVVPLDDNLNFHKVVAVGIAVGAVLHVFSYLACGFPRLLHATDAGYAPLAQHLGTTRPDSYWWFVKRTEGWTGLVMLLLVAVAFILATAWFRRGRIQLPWRLRRLTGFNAFWYTHHGFVVVYALLIVHGHFLYLTNKWYEKSTWMYLAVPMALYACERLTRVLRSTMFPVKMLKVAVYPGNVLVLQFSKPPGFRYKSGQYIFLNCPAISRFQWHPFCITSAPQDDYVSVHIRTLGDWTRELKNVFSRVCRPPTEGKSGLLRAEYDRDGSAMTNPRFLKVLIDGPYGLTAQDYKQYDVVLLISLGIGAAGMISIIRDIINNVKQRDDADLESGDGSNDDSVSSSFRTRRAYFYWATREQGSFDWFRDVMDEVVETDKEGVIELHNYCTSLYGYGDTRSALIAVLQSLNYAKHGIDVVSGTRVKTHLGTPDWCNIYKRIALNHRDQRVGVFYCGAPVLDKELRELAQDFSRKTTTKFEFHKENF